MRARAPQLFYKLSTERVIILVSMSKYDDSITDLRLNLTITKHTSKRNYLKNLFRHFDVRQ